MRILFATVLLGTWSLPVLAQSATPVVATPVAAPVQSSPPPTSPAAAPVCPPPRPGVGQGENGDWANLERYRKANQALIAQTAPAGMAAGRVVFMGDSITEFWAGQPFIKDSRELVGRGISGQTAGQMLVRFRADVIALKPAAVHIMAGTNDVAQNTGPETLEEIEGYIASMVDLARANQIRVILGSIPPAKGFGWRPDLRPAPQIIALNQWLKDYAARRKLAYVDYWSVLSNADGGMKPEFSRDGVHPNAAGYAAMQPLAEFALAGMGLSKLVKR